MANRREALTLVGGIALLGFALPKASKFIGSYVIDPPLMKIHKAPTQMPVVNFFNDSEKELTFSDFAGKHILVNIWAKWCPPCKEEMPSLDRLQEKLGENADLQIVAISVDPISFEQIQAFYRVIGIKNLALFKGDESEIMQKLKVPGLPTSLLLDHAGQEIGRMIGPTVWDSPRVWDQLTKLTE